MSLPAAATDTDNVADTCHESRASLTSTAQSEGVPSPPPSPAFDGHLDEQHLTEPSTLSFPTLQSDGSVPDLRASPTFPNQNATHSDAASSPRARAAMADYNDTDSLAGSVDDDYDMVEDRSEISTTDGRETASIASSDSDDEGERTPAEGDDSDDLALSFEAGSVGDLAGTLGVRPVHSHEEANRALDSIMSEDMETPRQSLLQTCNSHSSHTTSSSLPSKDSKSVPANHPPQLDILLYVDHAINSDVPAAIGKRLATLFDSTVPQQQVQLPLTPDDSRSTCLLRYDNVQIAVTHVGHDELPTAMDLLQDQSTPDLLVIYGPKSGFEVVPDCIDSIHRDTDFTTPILGIIKDDLKRDPFTFKRGSATIMNGVAFFESGGAFYKTPLSGEAPELCSTLREKLLSSSSSKTMPSTFCEKSLLWAKENSTLIRAASRTIGLWACAVMVFMLLLHLLDPLVKAHSSLRDVSIVHQQRDLSSSLESWVTGSNFDFRQSAAEVLPVANPPKDAAVVFHPNQVVITIAAARGGPTSRPASVDVTRFKDVGVPFNLTVLAAGIYGITVPIKEAYGVMTFEIRVEDRDWYQRRSPEVVLNLDFGLRPSLGSKYTAASKELSQVIGKDVAIARKAAQSVTTAMSREVSSSVQATRALTDELAFRWLSGVQVVANTTIGQLNKLLEKSEDAVQKMTKDLAVVRKDVIKLGDDFKKSVATTALQVKDLIVPSKRGLTARLKISRERAHTIKDVITGKKKRNCRRSKGVADC